MEVVDANKFKKAIIETLAKRAAYRCSNPDCQASTAGPSETENKSVIVGEAAHIYGAQPASARHLTSMAPSERSDITNAIWLCRNCHKAVDADSTKYPAELLFEWRAEHERHLGEELGRTGARIREKINRRYLEKFEDISPLSEQIILEKPYAWEYKLTFDLLRFKLEPIINRWDFLKKGLYTRALTAISLDEVGLWNRMRMEELGSIASAIDGLMNREFQRAWGEPGIPGNDLEIYRVCGLLAEAIAEILKWEERVRFCLLPDGFEEVSGLLRGIGGTFIDEVSRIPKEMGVVFDQDRPTGKYEVNLKFDLPPKWVENYGSAFRAAVRKASQNF